MHNKHDRLSMERFGDVGHGYMCTVGEKVRVRMRVRGHCMREAAMVMVSVGVRVRASVTVEKIER